MEYLVPLVTAVLGFIAGLVTPWVKDRVEVRQERRASRRARIDDWRKAVSEFDFQNPAFVKTFTTSPEYSALRQYMQATAIEKVEKDRVIYVGGGRGDDVRKHVLLDEISRLEKEWGLL
ncbi:MAG: hypothetical protein RQ754_16220 [Desulfuromonadales bacterium]|nr:hypothetical protein [Desulfuromonadales bacterium]